MTLWLRRTDLASPADADRADYLVIEHDKVIGRILRGPPYAGRVPMVLVNHRAS
jgi:hypothetical protein